MVSISGFLFLHLSLHLIPDGISYYVVAMARRSSSDLSLLEMHERSSCHPGIRTTVGWTVPIGYLVNTSQISVGEQCNFPKGETKRESRVCWCVVVYTDAWKVFEISGGRKWGKQSGEGLEVGMGQNSQEK